MDMAYHGNHVRHGGITIRNRIHTTWLAITQRWQRDNVINGDVQAYTTDEPTPVASFEVFFFRHERKIIGYLWRMTGDEDTALDLSQETFLRAWQRFPELQTYENAQAWLFRVATNLALNYLRSRSRLLVLSSLDEHTPEFIINDASTQIGEREHIQQILLALAPRHRALLVLRSSYGLSCEELGGVLGISPHAAQKALQRARVQFRDRYQRQER